MKTSDLAATWGMILIAGSASISMYTAITAIVFGTVLISWGKVLQTKGD